MRCFLFCIAIERKKDIRRAKTCTRHASQFKTTNEHLPSNVVTKIRADITMWCTNSRLYVWRVGSLVRKQTRKNSFYYLNGRFMCRSFYICRLLVAVFRRRLLLLLLLVNGMECNTQLFVFTHFNLAAKWNDWYKNGSIWNFWLRSELPCTRSIHCDSPFECCWCCQLFKQFILKFTSMKWKTC